MTDSRSPKPPFDASAIKGALCGIVIGVVAYALVIFALRIWIDNQ